MAREIKRTASPLTPTLSPLRREGEEAAARSAPHIFGVRHLSPAAAWHLRQLLDRVRPKLVLIEGSDDADDLIPHIVSPKSKLPIAILAYSTDGKPQSCMWPFVRYSPEYEALRWAREHGVKARFVDWPSGAALGAASTARGNRRVQRDDRELIGCVRESVGER